MQLIETKIKDLWIIEPNVFEDARGCFMELWKQDRYFKKNQHLPLNFVQDNMSTSHKGVLRGLHFQSPYPQGKLITVLQGSVYDVAVDLRKDSKTFGEWEAIVLSAENHRQFYIPEGFAHGFLALEDHTVLMYKCTGFYKPDCEKTLLWNDPDLQIDWEKFDIPSEKFIISPKDLSGLSLDMLF